MRLFAPDVPVGFIYRDAFLTAEEERALVEAIGSLSFDTFEMRGVVARRRVKFYGQSYNDIPSAPMPDFLIGVRAKLASWAQVPAEAFVMGLINEYRQGATIGWHRDAPQYDITAGVSLLSACRMRLRPYVAPQQRTAVAAARQAPRKTSHEIDLEPRSAYLITGAARSEYEHSIPATAALRYSITFRTLRTAR
jgi:alkylated DNA repair dioxygenase AlkB